MEFHFFQSVSFQKTGKELPISTRLCRLGFAGQEVVVRVIRVELLDNVHQKRRNRDRPCRGFRFGRSDVKIGLALLFVIDALDSLIDADGLILGRMASEIAKLLRGKHKPTYSPHMDMGDHVIIVNADKVVLSSDKANKKIVYRHSGFPGGIKSRSYANFLQENPTDAVRQTIRGMLPKNRLGRQQLKKLQVYAGAEHPHSAQKPEPMELAQAKSRES